jgi:hypothetical protein
METILVQTDSIIELGIPKKKLEGKSDRVVYNIFRKALQEFIDNLMELHGQKVVDTYTDSSDNHFVCIHGKSQSFTFINDFDYSASNRCEENKEYKVCRYFGASILLECPSDINIEDLLKSTRIVNIKGGNRVKIISSIVSKRPARTKGYVL